jgi:heme/copper-type cytochrome/quinol oxidase subunit 1
MEPVIVWYLRMSVVYFVVGAFIGFSILLWPDKSGYYIPVHVHVNLLGFMSMMIYGVGYHILPKFSGRYIYSPRIMKIQFWLSNAGLVGMSVSWPFVIRGDAALAETMLMVSALVSMISVVLFAFNILKTIKAV